MTTHRYVSCFAAICLFIALFPGSARGQDTLLQVKQEFCRDVSEESNEALDDLSEATLDLADCAVEFDDCASGLFNSNAASCTIEFLECTSEANEDQAGACGFFARRLGNTFEEALRDARQIDPENGEQRFLDFLDRTWGQQCMDPAIFTASSCATLIQ
jgi:hypothetical protein